MSKYPDERRAAALTKLMPPNSRTVSAGVTVKEGLLKMVKLIPILQRFAERLPLPVMIRALVERCLDPARLDAWSKASAEGQRTRNLLFSDPFGLMTEAEALA